MGKSVSRNSAFSMINKGLSVVFFPLVTVSYISRVFRSGRNWRNFPQHKTWRLILAWQLR